MKYKSKKVVLFIIIIVILLPNMVLARYYEILRNMKLSATVANPIVKVENLQEKVIQTFNKRTEAKEYHFVVRNYELAEDGISKKISDVAFLYYIEIINTNTTFPIKCELYDVQTNEKILDEKDKTGEIFMERSVAYEKPYKLVVTWEKSSPILADHTDININVQVTQKQ